MSHQSLLIYRCIIQRSAAAVPANVLGQPDNVVWANHLTDVHCRPYPMVTGAAAGNVAERETVFLTDVVSHYIIHFPKGTDVEESDQIINITQGGALVDAGPFNIILDKLRANSIHVHHLELVIKRVGPTAYGDPTV